MFKIFTIRRVLALICILTFSLSAVSLLPGLPVKKIGGKECYYYKVNKGEDIFTVSEKLGIPRSEIIEFNSAAADGIKSGMVLYFPVDKFMTERASEALTSEVEVPTNEAQEQSLTQKMRLNIVVCMPFELSEESPSKNALHATDFYKGLLLGIDSLRPVRNGPEINIAAFDVGKNEAKLDVAALRNLIDKDSHTILLAPDNSEKLMVIEKLASKNQVYVFNTFQTRDSTYLTNQYMIQGNIPAGEMYDKAILWFVNNLNGRTPVFLEREKGKKDKQAFVDELRLQLDRHGIPFETIIFDETLTQTELEERLDVNSSGYVFVPVSGEIKEFQKISSALAGFKNLLAEVNPNEDAVELFGYPEYIRFTGDTYERLKRIGTNFYTRSYNNALSGTTQGVEASYADRYGTDLPVGVPNQALYGFDVAAWLLKLAEKGELNESTIADVSLTSGLQTAYNFKRVPGGGLYNTSLMIVALKNDSEPEVKILK